MIKALIFDMDGVIIDSEPLQTEIAVQVLRQLGGNPKPSEIYEFVGVRNEEMWTTLKQRHNLQETLEEILEFHENHKKKRFAQETLKPIDGIPELIKSAKIRGLGIALATSSPKFLAEYILKSFKLYEYFDVLVTADDISHSKPDPEIFIKAASILNFKPDECIVIEDAYLGIKAAKRAGMKCIAYNNPNSGNQDISQANLIVSSIRDIDLDSMVTKNR